MNYGAIPQSSHAVQEGNAGNPVGASADASVKRAADFEGDALGYLQAVYSGAITGDPLRMNAAAVLPAVAETSD